MKDLNNMKTILHSYDFHCHFWCPLFLLDSDFPSAWRTFYNISYSVNLLVMNSFSFCMSESGFILSSYLKDIFTSYRILGWQLFSLFPLKMHFLFVLASLPSDEKSAIIYNVLVCNVLFFSESFKDVFFVFSFQHLKIFFEFCFLYLLGICWAYWICQFTSCTKIGNF